MLVFTAAGTVLASLLAIAIKIWTPDGQVIWADEDKLIGRRYSSHRRTRRSPARGTPTPC